jgi:glycosyltransferase involved in cell wall biosynthesis
MRSAYELVPVEGFTFVWIRMPVYGNAHSWRRVISWFLFSWRLRGLSAVIPHPPDAILYSSPSPIGFLGAHRLARRHGARLVYEMRDLWPMTLIELGGYSPRNPMIRFMQRLEDKAFRESDRVVSNLANAGEHLANRGGVREKFVWIPNGISLAEIGRAVPLQEAARTRLPRGKFLVGYTGTLGVANALDTLLDAAEQLKDEPGIAFVLVGEGKEKERLKQRVASARLANVGFVDFVPKVEIQAMLGMFDVCYIGWQKIPLYRFGIGANKLPEYLYSGRPIVHAYSGACDPVQQYSAGITVPAQDSAHLAAAILNLYRMPPEERAAMGANGRKAALEHYDYGSLAERLIHVFQD